MTKIIGGTKQLRGHIQDIEKGRRSGYLLLCPHDEAPEMPQSIVSFRHVYVQPKKILEQHASRLKTRLRLASPYREHLAQTFAQYFMRVGLPIAALSPDFR